MQCMYLNFDIINYVSQNADSQVPYAYFSVMALVLNDVNVRGDYVFFKKKKRHTGI